METKTQGFSLIEAVVTAVIVAILAAVAVPIYTGYIKDQRQLTVNNLAETAAAAANAYVRKVGGNFTTDNIANLSLYYNASKYGIYVSGNNIVTNELATPSITAQRPFQ